MSKRNINIDCYLYVNNRNNNPIQWMQIKENNNNKVLLYIPYIFKFENEKRITNFEDAVYKIPIVLPNSFNDEILKLFSTIYNIKDIIIPKHSLLRKEYKNIRVNIKLSRYTYIQLFFLNRLLSNIGYIDEIDDKHMTVVINYSSLFKQNNDQNNNNVHLISNSIIAF